MYNNRLKVLVRRVKALIHGRKRTSEELLEKADAVLADLKVNA